MVQLASVPKVVSRWARRQMNGVFVGVKSQNPIFWLLTHYFNFLTPTKTPFIREAPAEPVSVANISWFEEHGIGGQAPTRFVYSVNTARFLSHDQRTEKMRASGWALK